MECVMDDSSSKENEEKETNMETNSFPGGSDSSTDQQQSSPPGKVEPSDSDPPPSSSPILKKFFCPCCNIGYTTSEEMINHIKSSPITVKTYSCSVCMLEFFVRSDLLDHQRLDHQMITHKRFKCDECDLDYNSYARLMKHKRMHREIAEKLAASGIFLPAPSTKNKDDHDQVVNTEVPERSRVVKEESPSEQTCTTAKPAAEERAQTAEVNQADDNDNEDNDNNDNDNDDIDNNDDDDDSDEKTPPPRRRRGRKPKASKTKTKNKSHNLLSVALGTRSGKKKRGRPRLSEKGGPKKKKIKEEEQPVEQIEIPEGILNEDGSVRCPDCDVMCSSLNGLNRHRKFHFKTMDKLKCIFCDTVFHDRVEMGSHMTTVHPLRNFPKAYMIQEPEKKEYPCSQPGCTQVFGSSMTLTKHNTRVHGIDHTKANVCSDCGRVCRNKSALKVHRRMHTDERPFKCDLCPKKYRASSSLVLHRQTHTNKKSFTCELCGGGFACPNSLRRHMRGRHTGEKPYMCDACGATFVDYGQLAQHSKSNGHGKLSSPGKYACETCGKEFRTEFGIRSHKERCSREGQSCLTGPPKPKPVICDVCGREFPSKVNLKNHMVTHSDERPHKCRFCEATFRHYKSKYTHEKVHMGTKDFICAVCGKGFTQSVHLKDHMASHLTTKEFPCCLCGKAFNTKRNQKRHEKRCENYLKCHICAAIFRAHHRLERHMQMNHGGMDMRHERHQEHHQERHQEHHQERHQERHHEQHQERPQEHLSDRHRLASAWPVPDLQALSHQTIRSTMAEVPKFVDGGHPLAPPTFVSIKNNDLSDEEQYVVN